MKNMIGINGIGKEVVSMKKLLMCTHGGYGAGDSYNTIKEASHASNTPDGLAVKAEDVIFSQNAVNTWLKRIEVK